MPLFHYQLHDKRKKWNEWAALCRMHPVNHVKKCLVPVDLDVLERLEVIAEVENQW